MLTPRLLQTLLVLALFLVPLSQMAAQEVELAYGDGESDTGFMRGEMAGGILAIPEKGAYYVGYWGESKHRIAVQFESPFETSRLLRASLLLGGTPRGEEPACEYVVQVLGEDWEELGAVTALTGDVGPLRVDFSDQEVLAGRVFAISVIPGPCEQPTLLLMVDSSSSGHSYLIYEDEAPRKIAKGGEYDAFNEGHYDFMFRVVVEEAEAASVEPSEDLGDDVPTGAAEKLGTDDVNPQLQDDAPSASFRTGGCCLGSGV